MGPEVILLLIISQFKLLAAEGAIFRVHLDLPVARMESRATCILGTPRTPFP